MNGSNIGNDFDLICVIAADLRVRRGFAYPIRQALNEAGDIVAQAKRYYADRLDIAGERVELRNYSLPAAAALTWEGVFRDEL